MRYFFLALAAISTIGGAWQHNTYAFLFGCAWLIASAILIAGEGIAREINSGASRTNESVGYAGIAFAQAVNGNAARGHRDRKDCE